ncbi:unnamed protein product [Trypanosoma congolense IL3000]|uniref:WGS project CAEQ00000000 data, annotated contig 1902 n=1 Tax=Trypanosoma congolense (strain IL3000) TaxID=1068625 RepID=F9W9V7_TRYCI|nr:unnamed protein product [Trypanosoma congolense IL3000]
MSESPSSPSPEGMARENTPWSMEKDVVEVLLHGIENPRASTCTAFCNPLIHLCIRTSPDLASETLPGTRGDAWEKPMDGKKYGNIFPACYGNSECWRSSWSIMRGLRRVGGHGNGRCGGSFSSWMRRNRTLWRGWYGRCVACHPSPVGSWKRRTRLDTRGPFPCLTSKSLVPPYKAVFMLILYPKYVLCVIVKGWEWITLL